MRKEKGKKRERNFLFTRKILSMLLFLVVVFLSMIEMQGMGSNCQRLQLLANVPTILIPIN
jgi:hypothetical protein